VLVVGGVGPDGLAGTEIFDSRTGRWTPAAPLREQRRGHIAVTLPDQRVLVAGGLGEEGVLKSVEMYDPRSNRWIEAPDMVDARDGHDAVVLEALLSIKRAGADGILTYYAKDVANWLRGS